MPRPAGPKRRFRCSEPPRDSGTTTGRRCRPARSWPRSGPKRRGGPSPASNSVPCLAPPLPRQRLRRGSARSELWLKSSRPLMISWLRDGLNSGSCRSPGSATARLVRESRMSLCLPSRSGRSPMWSSRLVPKVGLEPTPSCEDRILSPARLPFRHFGSHAMVKHRQAPNGCQPRCSGTSHARPASCSTASALPSPRRGEPTRPVARRWGHGLCAGSLARRSRQEDRKHFEGRLSSSR
jgi:hypothetical protein